MLAVLPSPRDRSLCTALVHAWLVGLAQIHGMQAAGFLRDLGFDPEQVGPLEVTVTSFKSNPESGSACADEALPKP